MPDNAITKDILSDLNNEGSIHLDGETIYNVEIDLSKFHTYEEYNHTLSKSVRQNIRTAYNRIKRDGHEYSLNYFIGKNSDKNKVINGLKMYLKGQKERYDNFGFTHWIHFRFLHYVTQNMFEDYSFHASLEIDGKTAAMMQGFIDDDKKSIMIPRLSIDPEWAFYSPGYIMICEVIKKMYNNNYYVKLDLMRGCEKYKFDLGGTAYPSYNFNIDL